MKKLDLATLRTVSGGTFIRLCPPPKPTHCGKCS